MDESGQLVMNKSYEPVDASDSYDCGNESGWAKGLATSEPLHISMSASGGVLTRTHALTLDWYIPISGLVTIIVVPVDDEAVAFNPNSRAALSRSSWWATFTDNFPWPSSVLLTLR
jgi:hypothetical protein